MLVILAALMLGFFPLAPSPVLATAYSSEELAFVQLLNDYRASYGQPPLLLSDILADSSQKHNSDMGTFGFFSHTTVASAFFPVGSSPGARMALCGYPKQVGWGENLAAGYETADRVFTAWKYSESHRLNMLGSTWRVVGVSRLYVSGSTDGWYWCTDFGTYIDGTAHAPGTPSPTDTTGPSVNVTRPAAGSEVSGRVAVEVTATDNISVSRVELYGAGTLVGTDTSVPYTFTWDTAGMNPGSYALEARAYDSVGNVGSTTIQVQVSSSPTTTGPSTTTTSSTTTTEPPTTTTTTTPPPSTTTTTASTTTTLPGVPFPDVRPTSQYYVEIRDLAAAGIISGCADGLYHPERSVTRAQFAKIVVLGIGAHSAAVDNTLSPSFVDVRFGGSDYPFDYVEEAAALGIIQGYPDGTFRPGAFITRAQVALMLVRAGGTDLASPPAGTPLPFTDVPAYAREAVRVALYNHLVSGKSSTRFDPHGLATRGQVAKMIYSLRQVSLH
jgi:hypothetical protein